MLDKSVIKSLDENLLEKVNSHAISWSPFKTAQRVADYLEDCCANVSTTLGHSIAGDSVSPRPTADLFFLNVFYETASFRYSQRINGTPSRVQHLNIYDTPGGNQVDDFIQRFFAETLPKKETSAE